MENYHIRQITGLTEVKKEDGADLCGPLLSYDEEVILSYKSAYARVFFTSKRIILIKSEELQESKKEYLFIFYSRLSAFAIEANGDFVSDSVLKLWIFGIGMISLQFQKGKDTVQIAELIGSHTK